MSLAQASRVSPMARDPRLSAFQDEYPFDSHALDLPAGRLHFIDEGPRDAPVLFFLHGNPTWSFYWRRAILAFSKEYRCIAPDHLGCGLSDKPRDFPYRLANHIDHVEALVEALGIERLTLVLHDWGGAIGMGLAVRRPERIERLVITNTAAFHGEAAPWRIRACRVPGLGPVVVQGLNGFALAATRMAVVKPLPAKIREGLLLPYRNSADRIAIRRFVEDIPLNERHPSWQTLTDIEQGLEQFKEHPTLILWGERDFCFTPRFRERWSAFLPQARVQVFPDAGHYLMEDATIGVLDALGAFLSGN